MLARGEMAVAVVGGLISGVPTVLATQLPWLRDLAALLGIAATLMALGGSLLSLFVYKMVRRMLDEFQAAEDKRHHLLSGEVKGINDLLRSYVTKYDSVSERMKEMRDQLDRGQREFSRVRERLAAIESGGKLRRFPSHEEDNGDT